MNECEIREIERSELPAAFKVMCELRTSLDYETFVERYQRQSDFGYVLFGAFVDVLIGVIGVRPVETIARGRHLHVDDLIVTEHQRNKSYGSCLMRFVEDWALANELGSIFLDSRNDVVEYYASLGYELHTSPLMRKKFDKD